MNRTPLELIHEENPSFEMSTSRKVPEFPAVKKSLRNVRPLSADKIKITPMGKKEESRRSISNPTPKVR